MTTMPGSQPKRLRLPAALILVLVVLAAIAGPALGRTTEPPAVKVLSLDEAVTHWRSGTVRKSKPSNLPS